MEVFEEGISLKDSNLEIPGVMFLGTRGIDYRHVESVELIPFSEFLRNASIVQIRRIGYLGVLPSVPAGACLEV